jgi:hypothetical protein
VTVVRCPHRDDTDLARCIGPATFRLTETVDRYDQRSGHTEYRNSDADDHKAERLTSARLWREEYIQSLGKLAVPQESVKRGSGAQEREANPENDVQVPQFWAGLAQ